MSIRWMTRVWDEAESLDGTELLVLLCIADHAQDDTAKAWPSLARLQQRSRRSERTVRDAIRRLEEAGWVRCEFRPGRSTVYHLQTPAADGTPAVLAPLTPTPATEETPADFAGVEEDTPAAHRPPPRRPTAPGTIREPISSPSVDAAAGEVTTEGEQQPAANTRVTPPFPVVEQRKLVNWFRVSTAEQGEAWEAAWATAHSVTSTSDVTYDPQAHLAIYLSRCREERRAPRSDLWLRFFVEDRDKHIATLRQQQERQQRAEEDPQQREDRATRALPPADWGPREEQDQ